MTYHMVNNTSRAVTCIAKPSPYWYGMFYKLIKHLALVFDVLSDKKDIARDLNVKIHQENTSPIHEPLPMIIFFNLIYARGQTARLF